MKLTSVEALAFEYQLLERGYKKYSQDFKGSDFVYWKSFEKYLDEDDDEIPGYQIGIAFYDFSKYPQFNEEKSMHTDFHFMLTSNMSIDRLEMAVGDETFTVAKFEGFCQSFYSDWLKKNLIMLSKPAIV